MNPGRAPSVVSSVRSPISRLADPPRLLRARWPVAVAAGLTAAGVVLGRRSSTGGRRWRLGAGGALALTTALAVNRYVGYVPTRGAVGMYLASWSARLRRSTPPPGSVRTWRQAEDGSGRVLAAQVPVPRELRLPASITWVWTPPGYDDEPERRYPLLLMLHGTPGSSADWFAAAEVPRLLDELVSSGVIPPVVAVAPDLNGTGLSWLDTEGLDSTTGGAQIETFLWQVLLPWVQQRFRVSDDRRRRMLAGFSAGGFAALDQGLRHPELFATLLAFEPYGDPGLGGRLMLRTPQEWAEHDVSSYVGEVPLPPDLGVFVDIAGHTRGRTNGQVARSIAGALRARGAQVLVRNEPGHDHTWVMARHGLPHALAFAASRLPSDERRLAADPAPRPRRRSVRPAREPGPPPTSAPDPA
ncbi:MAG: hypothetical protein B7X40_07835 [Cellulomonas sp. 14-74-6]|nr:MAG: hypothetical protein B7X40_07835 [Cellulomonas sp. 14-74-6]